MSRTHEDQCYRVWKSQPDKPFAFHSTETCDLITIAVLAIMNAAPVSVKGMGRDDIADLLRQGQSFETPQSYIGMDIFDLMRKARNFEPAALAEPDLIG